MTNVQPGEVVWEMKISKGRGEPVHDSLHATEAGAYRALASWAREWWSDVAAAVAESYPDEGLDTTPPENDEHAIRWYFEHHWTEEWAIRPIEVEA